MRGAFNYADAGMLPVLSRCQWENEPEGVPLRIKHSLHSSAVRYGEILHKPKESEISRHISR